MQARDALPAKGKSQEIGSRERQEDFAAFSNYDPQRDHHAGIAAVLCDGMGGMSHGLEAAKIGCATFLTAYAGKRPEESIPDALRRSLRFANLDVHSAALKHGAVREMGSTLVAAVVQNGQLFWASVGDSRIYVGKQGRLTQITQDHTFGRKLDERVRLGTMTHAEAQAHPRRDSLTSHLGLPELPDFEVSEVPRKLVAGEWVLVCSDGLYGSLSPAEMGSELYDEPESSARRLVAAALAKNKPGQDNVTVLLMYVQEDGAIRRSLETDSSHRPLAVFAAAPADGRATAVAKNGVSRKDQAPIKGAMVEVPKARPRAAQAVSAGQKRDDRIAPKRKAAFALAVVLLLVTFAFGSWWLLPKSQDPERRTSGGETSTNKSETSSSESGAKTLTNIITTKPTPAVTSPPPKAPEKARPSDRGGKPSPTREPEATPPSAASSSSKSEPVAPSSSASEAAKSSGNSATTKAMTTSSTVSGSVTVGKGSEEPKTVGGPPPPVGGP